MSANAAADRVRRLREDGVITGFTALVDPAAGGRRLEALVGVTLARGTDSDAFAILVDRLEAVTEVLHLSGSPDYQLRVSCRDTAELDVLLRTLRMRAGAADTETTIILRSGPPRGWVTATELLACREAGLVPGCDSAKRNDSARRVGARGGWGCLVAHSET